MGATRVPVITNPGNDPGRNQPRGRETDSPDVRGGNYRDLQSQMHNPGGAATCRKTWFGGGNADSPSGEAQELASSNADYPRDRGNRGV